MISVAEPHHFYAAPAPAPTLLNSKAKCLKRSQTHVQIILFILFCTIYIAENMN
jgi:hypothetical protein